jgi:hypothetical protein
LEAAVELDGVEGQPAGVVGLFTFRNDLHI